MKTMFVGKSMRFFLLTVAILIWLGIYLTGFKVIHWIIYIPAVFFVFAAVTGICPGMIFSQKIFKE